MAYTDPIDDLVGQIVPRGCGVEREFHAAIENPANATGQEFLWRWPDDSGVAVLEEAGTTVEYRITHLHITLDADATLSIDNANGAVWGPHTLAAGFWAITLPGHPVTRSWAGVRCGRDQKITLSCDAAQAAGLVEIYGVRVPAQADS